MKGQMFERVKTILFERGYCLVDRGNNCSFRYRVLKDDYLCDFKKLSYILKILKSKVDFEKFTESYMNLEDYEQLHSIRNQ